MPRAEVAGLTINYEDTGSGDPLLLIPYTGADHACYAFQMPAYTEHFRCISVDLPGSGESSMPAGPYSTVAYADQLAGFLEAIGVRQAHVAGVSLGAAVGMHLAARNPQRVRSLSLHSAWPATDAHLRTLVTSWMALARGLPTVADAVVLGIFPWCFPPETYAARPELIAGLEDFVRGRPAQPLDAFLSQCQAVLAHDAVSALSAITAPTLITFGGRDLCTSTRFAPALTEGIQDSTLVVFDDLSHAGLHEDPETFNTASLDFLLAHRT